MRIRSPFLRRYIIVIFFLGILHHLDHVLRYDHSGWPFRPEVTPFTYSLLVYPLGISLLFISHKIYRVVVSLLMAISLFFAHTFLETPFDQYTTWATNRSPFLHALDHPNLLNISSPLLGIIAVALSLLLTTMVIFLPIVSALEVPERR